jgi:hypothetical protein
VTITYAAGSGPSTLCVGQFANIIPQNFSADGGYGQSDITFSACVDIQWTSGLVTARSSSNDFYWAGCDSVPDTYYLNTSGGVSDVNSHLGETHTAIRMTSTAGVNNGPFDFTLVSIHGVPLTATPTFPFITATLNPTFSGGGVVYDGRPPCTSTPVDDPTPTATSRAVISTIALPTVILPHATLPMPTLTMGATVPHTPTPTPTGDPTTTLEPTATPDGNCRIIQQGGPGGTAPPVVDFSLSDPTGGTCGSVFPEVNIVIAPITSVLGITLPIQFPGLTIQAHRIDICVAFQEIEVRVGDLNLGPYINAIFVILFVGMILQFRREL